VSCVNEGHDHDHAIGSLPLWTPDRAGSARRLNAITHLPAPIAVAPAKAPALEEK
jgi:hypothetical protein